MKCRQSDAGVAEVSVTRRHVLGWAGVAPFAFMSSKATATSRPAPPEQFAELVASAVKNRRRVALATSFEPAMSEDRAYEYQDAVVRRLAGRSEIAGIKGGGMTAASQSRLGGGPFFGALLPSGTMRSGVAIDLDAYRELVLETEIGFELGRPVSNELDMQGLRGAIAGVRPVIELPDNMFERNASFTSRDLIAANVLARCQIVGTRRFSSDLDVDAITVRLSRDGKEIHSASASGTFGGQWDALLWIVNNAVRRRGRLAKGCLVITGALGGVLRAQAGSYRADFGPLGVIEFAMNGAFSA